MDQATQTIQKGKKIGSITHYFDNIGVGVLALTDSLAVGDTIVISGHGKEFEQPVDSMQVEHEQVTGAKAGDSVGLKIAEPIKKGCEVYLKG